jgi:DNA mismatch endonuclease (patch repair protein)
VALRRHSNSAKKCRYPSFEGLKPASPVSSQTKKANRSQGTKHELCLVRDLKRLGVNFNRNEKSLPGKPDIVFPIEKVVVFCDGDFWHGRRWCQLHAKLKSGNNGDYWTSKIRANRLRDRKCNLLLRSAGWTVLRFWESQTRNDRPEVVKRILQAIELKRFK